MKIIHNESKLITNALSELENLCDSARIAVLGDSAKQKEYALSEQQAREYKNNAYTGEPPAAVMAWVKATQKSFKDAADDILRAAFEADCKVLRIREIRLKAKEAIKQAPNSQVVLDQINLAKSALATFTK